MNQNQTHSKKLEQIYIPLLLKVKLGPNITECARDSWYTMYSLIYILNAPLKFANLF